MARPIACNCSEYAGSVFSIAFMEITHLDIIMPGVEIGQIRWGSTFVLTGILLGTVLIRLIRLDQPIVENYVGRQIPTAMVARNLDRGSGFLRPQLDTAPFPNYFVVEPPVYQFAVVCWERFWGWKQDASGRFVSAIATALGAWGLFGLVRRREGELTALAAVVAFSLFPITLRYGRAFQPDALMLGAVLAALECWDRAREGLGRWWLLPAWPLLALGLAAKVTAAFVLVPLALVIERPRSLARMFVTFSALAPVLFWYLWANHLVDSGGGSRASAENRAIWIAVFGVTALGTPDTLAYIGRFLVVRAFTPPGVFLAVWGLCRRPTGSGEHQREGLDLWRIWGLAALATMALLAQKLHHEYYWLCLAPAIAAGLGRAWSRIHNANRGLAWVVAGVLLASSAFLARSTWQTPVEWKDLEAAAGSARATVPTGAWLVAAEPLLYQADRRGCRLEFTPQAAARAAAEWAGATAESVKGPLDLIDFYRRNGARFVADVGPAAGDQRRKALHQAIRERYKILVDQNSVMIAELTPPEDPGHGQ